MKILRFIFPFLFLRNWHTGEWEYSRARLVVFLAGMLLCMLAIGVAYVLQAPVEYVQSTTTIK